MISRYSIITAIILFNLFLVVVAVMRRKTSYLVKHSTFMLVVLTVFGAVRMVTPMSFPFTRVIRSFSIYPAIVEILDRPLFTLGTVVVTVQCAMLFVWGIGALIMLLHFTFLLFKTYRQRRKYRIVENTQIENVAKRLQLGRASVFVSPDVNVPYVTGLFKPYIYLPNIELSENVIDVILRHEYQHFKSRDVVIKAFYFLLHMVFWWNPVVHIFQRELDKLLELRCDMAVLAKLNEQEKTAYLEALYIMIERIYRRSVTQGINSLALVRAESKIFINQRIDIIVDKGERKFKKMRVISLLLVTVIFLSSYFVIIQPAHILPLPTPGEEFFTISPETSRIIIANDGTYWLYVDGHEMLELDEHGHTIEVLRELINTYKEE